MADPISPRPARFALLAQEQCLETLVDFCRAHSGWLKEAQLLCQPEHAALLKGAAGLRCEALPARGARGWSIIGAMLNFGEIDGIALFAAPGASGVEADWAWLSHLAFDLRVPCALDPVSAQGLGALCAQAKQRQREFDRQREEQQQRAREEREGPGESSAQSKARRRGHAEDPLDDIHWLPGEEANLAPAQERAGQEMAAEAEEQIFSPEVPGSVGSEARAFEAAPDEAETALEEDEGGEDPAQDAAPSGAPEALAPGGAKHQPMVKKRPTQNARRTRRAKRK